MAFSLYHHNQIAYESASSLLKEEGKATIIHPTGTGKSFIGFKLCADNANKIICWLSPSEYIYKTQIENWQNAGGEKLNNIKFFTYAKLMLMSENGIKDIAPDYIVLDEFHRAGAEMWQQGVERLLSCYDDVPILGLSATNIRYLDNQRDMAAELFDGNIASEMTLGEAIVRGILNAPTYIISQYKCAKDLKRYEDRARRALNRAVRDAAQKYIDAIRRTLDKADGLNVIFEKYMTDRAGKYIVFCSDKEHMDEMLSCVPDWFYGIDKNLHIYKAYSDDPETSKAFKKFKTDNSEHLKLLFCIDMLNEGVHVDDVSGVILFRPTVSPIIYKQQIGRALSASKNKQPVILDIVNNFENLYSIGLIEDEMQVAINYYRSLGLNDEIVNERFSIVDETRDSKQLFDALENTLSTSWDLMFGYARKYYSEYGNLEVERRYKTKDGYSLGHWIHTQRKVRAGKQFGILTPERIKRLDEIGMVWDSRSDTSWNKHFEAAKKYYEENGDLNVVASYVTKSGIKLGQWLNNLRTYKKSGIRSSYLTAERIKALEDIGLVWNQVDYYWERNFKAAKKYYNKHGNLDVRADCVVDGIKLGLWVRNLRLGMNGLYGHSKPTAEQIERLNGIGMLWTDKFGRAWEYGYSQAVEYYKENNNLNVPAAFINKQGFKLGDWISNQREKYFRGKLEQERVDRLNMLGMIWQKEDSWEVRYALAKEFYEENGHLNIPPKYTANGIWLNKWLNEQKQIYNGKRKGKQLTQEQISRLEAIGMRWCDWRDDVWYERYAEAKDYFDTFGNIAVPRSYKTSKGTWLANWITKQRADRKKGKLSEEQITLLDALGMVWEFADTWEVGFSHAEGYYKQYGNLIVPNSYICEDGYTLGHWVANQRANLNSNDKYRALSQKQIERLESIGMVWNVLEFLWNRAYKALSQYLANGGTLRMTKNFTMDDVNLQSWVAEQRKAYKHGRLSDEKILRLASIGVITIPDEPLIAIRKAVGAGV